MGSQGLTVYVGRPVGDDGFDEHDEDVMRGYGRMHEPRYGGRAEGRREWGADGVVWAGIDETERARDSK